MGLCLEECKMTKWKYILQSNFNSQYTLYSRDCLVEPYGWLVGPASGADPARNQVTSFDFRGRSFPSQLQLGGSTVDRGQLTWSKSFYLPATGTTQKALPVLG